MAAWRALLIMVSAWLSGCGGESSPAGPALRFWHTFNQAESEALQGWLAKTGKREVVATILPFARANIRFRSAVEDGDCPDLLRMDSTRIPGLVAGGFITEVPDETWQRQVWLPEAASLVRYREKNYGLPQSIDGLALIRRRQVLAPWPFPTLQALEEFAKSREQSPGARESSPLGLLVDGYWFVAFLRNAGAKLPDATGTPLLSWPFQS